MPSKEPEEMELLSWKPGWGDSKGGEIADMSLRAAASTSLAWRDFLLYVGGGVGDLFSIPSLECPDLSPSVGGKAASGFIPCSTKGSKQNTMSPNCESWNYLWTWPLESEPQTSLITFEDLGTGYHGDENHIWNSSLVYCALAAGMGKQLIMTITEIMPKTYIHTVWSVGFLIRRIKLLLSFLSPAGNKIWKEISCSIFNVPV